MAQDRIAEQVAGVVSCSNVKGFQLEGRDGWLNISKYAQPQPEVPPAGAQVQCSVDKAGYVRSVEVMDNGHDEATPAETGAPVQPDRETCITRMACLNTSTAVLTSSGPVDVAELLRLAGTLEEWVTRPYTSALMPGQQSG